MKNPSPLLSASSIAALLVAVMPELAAAQGVAPAATELGFEVAGRSVQLTWTGKASPDLLYRVESRRVDGTWEALSHDPILTNLYDVTALVGPGETRTFRVVTEVPGMAPGNSYPVSYRWKKPTLMRHTVGDMPGAPMPPLAVGAGAPMAPPPAPVAPVQAPAMPVQLQPEPIYAPPAIAPIPAHASPPQHPVAATQPQPAQPSHPAADAAPAKKDNP